MPHQNPRTIFRTPDNMEWTLLETFPDYKKLQQFRLKNHSSAKCSNEKRSRIRFYCYPRPRGARNCEFMLLAQKTTKKGYHVYKHGDHNHAALVSRETILIPMADAHPPEITHKPDNIEWAFLATFPDLRKVDKFRRVNECRSTLSDKKGLVIRYHCKFRYSHSHGCKFMLAAIKTTKQRYHVYKHGKHILHPAMKQMHDQEEGEEEEMEEEGGDDDADEDHEDEDEDGEDYDEVEEESEDEEEEEESDEEEVQIEMPIDEQEEEEREGSLEIEIIGQHPLQNANNQPLQHKPKEIHEFYNVGAWLRRKR